MAGLAHDRVTLARFQDGEQRLVYARYRDHPSAPLYFLKDDTAAELKAWTKEHLECFLPDCPDRWLTTVARKGRRDGFTHRSGAGGHGKEGLFHEQGKALIQRWAQERYPHVRAALEQSTLTGARRADAMLTWPDGAQVAIEVQYAAITPQEWLRRHDSYREQGITDVWLFGHIPPHLREARPPVEEHISLQPVHYTMLEAGVPLLWINPIRELVATVWQEVLGPSGHGVLDTRYQVPPLWANEYDRMAQFAPIPIEGCDLSPAGLTFPFLDRLIGSKQRLEDALERRAHIRRKREEANRAREAKKEAEAAAKAAEFLRWWNPREPAWKHQWEQSDDRAWLVQNYGEVPEVIGGRTETFGGVLAYHEHWHTVLYRILVVSKRPDQYWSLVDARTTLRSAGFEFHPTNPGRVDATLFAFISRLADAGHVRLMQNTRDGAAGTVPSKVGAPIARVVGDIEELLNQQWEKELRAAAKAPKPPPEPTTPAEHHQMIVNHQARIAEARATFKSRPVRPIAPPAQVFGLACAGCGGRLDPALAKTGRHFGC